ncbi:MAG: class I SAM-dependent methyltransferase [Nitrosomonadales bacterium]|nr:class I SAM-dependent methyltransferase [Nitrosomonadales bacterium]
MNLQPSKTLEFSGKYDEKHAQEYFEKHEYEFWRRLSNWRDHQIARKALRLAGNPKSVLDTPCGTGRFWDLLAEDPDRMIHASDYNQTMIDAAMINRPKAITSRVKTFQASAFELPVPDNFVDNIFCIRFVHHLGKSEERLKLLKEFHRVSKDTDILSLWVDGNYKAMRRRSQDEHRQSHPYQNRFLIPAATIEAEFSASGFSVVERLDFLKYYHMWRTYILRKKQD